MRTKNLWWGYKAREDGMILDPNGVILQQHMYGKYYGVILKNPNNHSRKQIHVHRLMARAFLHNPRPDVFTLIDHIDRNELNNEMFSGYENLRWLNTSLNALNRDTKGAYFNQRWKKWEARVCNKSLGWFKTYQEAHLCSKKHKRELFSRTYTQLCENGIPVNLWTSSLETSDRSPSLC